MAFGAQILSAYLGPNSRSIGVVVPDVVIEEAHRDPLVITQHPVDRGTAITDHAFAAPATVVIRAGFSNSSAGDPGYARAVYQELLAWKASRDPRDVSTGKRLYRNMLPADIAVHTDARTENVLAVTVLCQQVTITSTQRTGTGTSTAQAGAGTANRGTQQGQQIAGQDFAGAFGPGTLNSPGLSLDPYGFGSGDGLSPPQAWGEVGPITIEGEGSTGSGIDFSNAANGYDSGIF